MRLALRATRWRLVRLLLVETLILAGVGAVAGLVFARWATPFLVAQLSTSVTRVSLDLSLDRRVLMFTVVVTGLTAGLLGVTSYAVTRRRAEIGIRMALGAIRAGVGRLVLARVVGLVALGVIIGAAMSWWSTQFIASLLYELQPRDALTLVSAAVTLTLVGVHAGWVPAYRALQIDPAQVRREG